MNRKFVWLVIALILTSLACNLGEKAVETAAPQDQEPEQATPGAESLGAGPATLELADSALAAAFTSSVIQHSELIYTGLDSAGQPLQTTQIIDYTEQTEPTWYSVYYLVSRKNGVDIDAKHYAVVKGKNYTLNQNGCSLRDDTVERTPLNQQVSAAQELEGTARRAQTGVTLLGVLTDQYDLGVNNLRYNSGIKDFTSARLYRAQQGGYLVRLEYTLARQPDTSNPMQADFDPTKLVQVDYVFEQTFYPAGSLPLKLPAACPQP